MTSLSLHSTIDAAKMPLKRTRSATKIAEANSKRPALEPSLSSTSSAAAVVEAPARRTTDDTVITTESNEGASAALPSTAVTLPPDVGEGAWALVNMMSSSGNAEDLYVDASLSIYVPKEVIFANTCVCVWGGGGGEREAISA